MSGRVLIAGYQIGYRLKGIGGYTEPYADLPMFRVRDPIDGFACAEACWQAVNAIHKQLQQDFPNAEWRMIECWE
jgi:hypothetical protein